MILENTPQGSNGGIVQRALTLDHLEPLLQDGAEASEPAGAHQLARERVLLVSL